MDYLTAAEIANKWKVSSRMAAYYCEAGRIEGAVKKERPGLFRLILQNLWISVIQEILSKQKRVRQLATYL